MISKGKIYSIVENITPPFIFKFLKNSSLYPWLVKKANNFSHTNTQEVYVAGGPIAGLKLKIDPNGPWQHEMISGEYDKELFNYLEKVDLKSKVVYDIGAHIGYHSLAFAKMAGDGGHTYAFEPNPANAERAKEIISLNPSVKDFVSILNLALSDHVGTTDFLSTNDIEIGTSTGGFIDEASTLWERDRYIDKVGFKRSKVNIETIDNLVKTKKVLPPHLLKIDVEGAEQLVLKGAEETLSNYKPIIIVEFHSIYSAYSSMLIMHKFDYVFELLKQEPDGRVMIVAK